MLIRKRVTPVYDRDGIRIYHADCRKVADQLYDDGVEAVVTDIPYAEVNNSDDSGGLRVLKKGSADVETFDFAGEIERFLRVARGTIYTFCGVEQISDIRRAERLAGMTTRLGYWRKTNPSPMNGQHFWVSALEACVFARKSGSVFNRHCEAFVITHATCRKSPHPTPKPVPVMEELILASTKPGDVVFDPFMGCGPTLIAAKRTRRRAIGAELNREWIDYTIKVLDSTSRGFGLS